jgi:hypothetical protein
VLLLQLTYIIIGMSFFIFSWTLLFLAYVSFLEVLGYVYFSKSNRRSVALLLSPLTCTTSGFTCKITSTPSADVRIPSANIIIDSAAEILTVIFWLATWALLASEASAFITSYTLDGITIDLESYYPSNWKAAIDCTKASAGLGALEWVLFIVTLVFFGTFPGSPCLKSNFRANRFGYRYIHL